MIVFVVVRKDMYEKESAVMGVFSTVKATQKAIEKFADKSPKLFEDSEIYIEGCKVDNDRF
jgi:hypothetical protein